MLRLLSIEWLKIKSWKTFWIMIAAYTLIIFMTIRGAAIGARSLSKNLPIDLDVFQFPGVWHNVTFAAGVLNILLAAIMIFYVCNEYRNSTLRKQITDGLSEAEFIIGKVLVVLGLALLSTIILMTIGLILGSKPPNADLSIYWQQSSYLGMHFLAAITYMSIAMLIAVFVKRAVPALLIFIVLHVVETIIINKLGTSITELLPLRAMDDLIPTPVLHGRIGKVPQNSITVIISAVLFYFVLTNVLSWLKLKRSSF